MKTLGYIGKRGQEVFVDFMPKGVSINYNKWKFTEKIIIFIIGEI